MSDFSNLDELRRLIAKYPVPGDGVVFDAGDHYAVRLQMLPGPVFNGTLPKTPEVDAFIDGRNWRRVRCGNS